MACNMWLFVSPSSRSGIFTGRTRVIAARHQQSTCRCRTDGRSARWSSLDRRFSAPPKIVSMDMNDRSICEFKSFHRLAHCPCRYQSRRRLRGWCARQFAYSAKRLSRLNYQPNLLCNHRQPIHGSIHRNFFQVFRHHAKAHHRAQRWSFPHPQSLSCRIRCDSCQMRWRGLSFSMEAVLF